MWGPEVGGQELSSSLYIPPTVLWCGDGPLSQVFGQWKERCWTVNTLTDFKHDGAHGCDHFRFQIKGIIGKGGLGEETQLLLSDGEFWIIMDVSENVKEDIQNEVLGVHDVVEVWKTVGVLHNATIVSAFPFITLYVEVCSERLFFSLSF